jgi:hypothetical protein
MPGSAPTGHAVLLLLFGVVALAEAAVGVLLWRGRRRAAFWSLALLPVEIAFWVGFALPLATLSPDESVRARS